MGKLSICSACRSHVKSGEPECPHCGAPLEATRGRGTVALLGLALAGCPSGDDASTSVGDTTSATNPTGSTSTSDSSSTSITTLTDPGSDLDSAYGTPDPSETFTTSGPSSSGTEDSSGTGSDGTTDADSSSTGSTGDSSGSTTG